MNNKKKLIKKIFFFIIAETFKNNFSLKHRFSACLQRIFFSILGKFSLFGKKNFFEVSLSHPLERRKKVFGAIPRTNFFKTKKFRFVLNRIFFECRN